MITSRIVRLSVTFIAAGTFVATHAADRMPVERKLQFNVSAKAIGLGLSDLPSEAKYVGTFHVVKDREYESWLNAVSGTSAWKEMSEAQRQFLSKLQELSRVGDTRIGSPFSMRSDYTETPGGTLSYRVYAVSEPDARRTAEAVIEWLDKKAAERVEELQQSLDGFPKAIAQINEKLPKLATEYEQLRLLADQKIKEYRTVNYGIDVERTADHARKSMEELAHKLQSADFELVGLRARIDAIAKFRADGTISDQGTLARLGQMLIVDEIERAGVLAKRDAYEASLGLAKEVYDTIRSRDELSLQIENCEAQRARAKEDALRAEEMLADLPAEMRPVDVYEDTVTIYPIRASQRED